MKWKKRENRQKHEEDDVRLYGKKAVNGDGEKKSGKLWDEMWKDSEG